MATVRGAAASSDSSEEFDANELEAKLARVASRAESFAELSASERARLLDRVITDTLEVSTQWNEAACVAKRYDPRGSDGAEELFSGVGTFVRMARTLKTSLDDIARRGRPEFPGPVRHRAGGRISVGVMPANVFDRVVYPSTSAEVWMRPGLTEADVRSHQAAAYHDPTRHRGLAVVLGAGNVASLSPRDVLGKMFIHGKVAVLKASPVNDYLVPWWRRALAALIEEDYLALVEGGSLVGEYLTNHHLVDDIHVTGSDKTFDAIVFGSGEEGRLRKTNLDPRVVTPVSAELGNVSPVVVVPGEWSEAEIRYQARHVATMISNNAGFNCLTPRVLVTHAQWAQRSQFFEALEEALRTIPTRLAYYPGASQRRDDFLAAHPDAHEVGERRDDTTPWTLIRDVDPTKTDDICFNVEAFCALCSETGLDADDAADFLRRSVDFCNDVLWGSLSMTLLCDPRSMKDPVVADALEHAITHLHYGTVGVNVWHALGFAFATPPWGAFPHHTLDDIQSGRGFVGNTFMFDDADIEKTVLRGPFVARPTPAWFATSTQGPRVMARLLAFEAAPSWGKLPGLLRAAL